MLFVRCRHIRHVDELVTCDGVLFVVVTCNNDDDDYHVPTAKKGKEDCII